MHFAYVGMLASEDQPRIALLTIFATGHQACCECAGSFELGRSGWPDEQVGVDGPSRRCGAEVLDGGLLPDDVVPH